MKFTKAIFLLVIFQLSSLVTIAQKSSSELKLPIDRNKHTAISVTGASVDVVGYDGNDIVMISTASVPIIEQFKGFNHLGPKNRTPTDSLITYKVLSNTASLFQIGITGSYEKVILRIPNKLKLFSITANSQSPKARLVIKNYNGALQAKGSIKNIDVTRVTGPLLISGEFGHISLSNIFWTKTANWDIHPFPYMITSLGSNIEVKVPKRLQSSFSINNTNGAVFSNLSLTSKLLMNGGGVKIYIESRYGDIYLVHK